MAMPSTAHLKMKFCDEKNGALPIKADKTIAREYHQQANR
ncbi:hypothetical protein A2U01_0038624, partial [Trifolium medium]|nr:hypothetical protein [Trifolium medium]